MIGRVYLFVGWFVSLVRSFFHDAHCDFMKFGIDIDVWHLCQISILTFQRCFKVQGQNRRTENRQLVIARSRFKIPSPMWQSDRSNFGIKDDFRQHSRWWSGGDLRCTECSVSLVTYYGCRCLMRANLHRTGFIGELNTYGFNQSINLYLSQAKAHTNTNAHTHTQKTNHNVQ